VVIDEVMGMCLTMVAAPVSWGVALLGFLLFRLFDVVKPPPARRLERLHAGWGIMLDDFAAALYAWIVLRMFVAWGPPWML
jgi:phosphatidylglycerophosphatase A